MKLEEAFTVFCEQGQHKFRGYKQRVVGMDGARWRRLCRISRLTHGGFKERDVSIVFANVRYPGTHIIDYDQFKNALEIIAVKRKMHAEQISSYIIQVAESIAADPSYASDVLQNLSLNVTAGNKRLAFKQKHRVLNAPQSLSNTSNQQHPASVYPSIAPAFQPNTFKLQQQQVTNAAKAQSHRIPNTIITQTQNSFDLVELPSPVKELKTSTFSLTDYLNRKKDSNNSNNSNSNSNSNNNSHVVKKEVAEVGTLKISIEAINRSLKQEDDDGEAAPAYWSDNKGASGSSVVLKESPTQWDWSK